MSFRKACKGDRANAMLRQQPGLEQIERLPEGTRLFAVIAAEHEGSIDLCFHRQPDKSRRNSERPRYISATRCGTGRKPALRMRNVGLFDKKIGRVVRQVGNEELGLRCWSSRATASSAFASCGVTSSE